MAEQNELAKARKIIKGHSIEKLQKLLANGIRIIREQILMGGAIVAEIEARGGTPQGDKNFIDMLRRIGEGTLLPDAVTRFGYRGHTFDCLKAMPVDEQAEVLKNDDDAVEKLVKRPAPSPGAPGMTADSFARRVMGMVHRCDDPAAAAQAAICGLRRVANRTAKAKKRPRLVAA